MIHVTKAFLPPIEEYQQYLNSIWKCGQLTNAGPFVQQLEEKLRHYLENKNVFFVANGTVALQIAIKALELKDDVLTTPLSYVATTSSIAWENCRPIFADIDEKTLNIDPKKITSSITSKTTGIIATHVYGHPCDVEAITEKAKQHQLKVIYDAAHCFGVRYKGQPITHYGDISTLSFHATKLFHTIEGGAIITQDDNLAHKISYLRNFGHNGPEAFHDIGINGKNSEFHAAMGLCNLPRVADFILERKQLSELYDSLLASHLQRPLLLPNTEYNHAYYPVIFTSEAKLLHARDKLNAAQIFPRRYFYPSLSQLNYVAPTKTPIAENIAPRVLCLPLYVGLDPQDIRRICHIILAC